MKELIRKILNEEEPGWIEDLYLAKLRGKEQERVNQEDGENDFDYDDDDY